MTVYTPPRAAAPIIRVSVPRAPAAPKKHHKGRRRGGGGRSETGKDYLFKMGVGGAAYGFAEKSGMIAKLPSLPMLGTAGSVAVIGYFTGMTKKPGIMRDTVLAAAVIAGYQLGKDGKIAGEDD